MKKSIDFVTVAILLACFGGCNHSSSPSQAVQKYYKLAEKGDVDGCVKLTAKRDLNKENGPFMARIEAAAVGGALHDNGGLSSIVIKNETVTGESAEVDIEVLLNNGKTDKLNYKLVKEENEWRLLSGA